MTETKELVELNDKGKPIEALKRLSPSSINSWYKCPREFYYSYIMKKRISNIHLIKGSIVHKVLEDFYKGYQADPKHWLLDSFIKEWMKNSKQLRLLELSLGDLLIHKKDAFRMIMDFYYLHDRKIKSLVDYGKAENERHAFFLTKPKFREMWVEDKELKCAGYIDRVHEDYDGVITLGDYKTSSRFGIGISNAYKRQLSIYALLYNNVKGIMADFVSIIFLRYGEEPLLEVTPSLLRYARDTIKHVWENTRSVTIEDYPLHEGKLCGWCSFRPLCSGEAECKSKGRIEDLKKLIGTPK